MSLMIMGSISPNHQQPFILFVGQVLFYYGCVLATLHIANAFVVQSPLFSHHHHRHHHRHSSTTAQRHPQENFKQQQPDDLFLLFSSSSSSRRKRGSSSSSPVQLYARQRLHDNNDNDNDGDENSKLLQSTLSSSSSSDPPLASLMENSTALSTKFTLANTPENDYIELQVGQRLVCIGDVHGDFEALQELLTVAGVYNKTTDSWCGGNTILVQCGDVLDRWSEELKCYELLSKLSHEAMMMGKSENEKNNATNTTTTTNNNNNHGKVILLLGNHEVLNAMGLFEYATTDREYEQVIGKSVDEELNSMLWRIQYVGNQPARWATYEPGGLLARSLMANMKVAIQVGKTVCVHAGLTADHIKEYGGIASMNQQAHDWFLFSNKNNENNNKSNKKKASSKNNKRKKKSSASSKDDDGDNDIMTVKYNNKGRYDSFEQRVADAEARQESYINTAPGFLNGGIGTRSPIWMRDYSSPNDLPPKNPKAQTMIDDALNAIGNDAQRMVMGHTVQRQINAALNGKAWRVDVGASKGVIGGTPEVLEIIRIDEEGNEEVNILTRKGKVPSSERQILAILDLF